MVHAAAAPAFEAASLAHCPVHASARPRAHLNTSLHRAGGQAQHCHLPWAKAQYALAQQAQQQPTALVGHKVALVRLAPCDIRGGIIDVARAPLEPTLHSAHPHGKQLSPPGSTRCSHSRLKKMGTSCDGSSSAPSAPAPAVLAAGAAGVPCRGLGSKANGDREPLGSRRVGLQSGQGRGVVEAEGLQDRIERVFGCQGSPRRSRLGRGLMLEISGDRSQSV